MKKHLPIFFFFFFTISACFSQKIDYEKTFSIAKEKSIQQNKVLFLNIVLSPTIALSANIKDITIKEVVEKYNEDFINYKGDQSMPEMREIISKYRVTIFPALIFFDSKGSLLYQSYGTSTTADKYLILAKTVNNLSKEKSLKDYDLEYKNGAYDKEFLKNYIDRRVKAGITNNWILADKYVDFLKVSELEQYNEVLFILNCGPLAYGKAYKLATLNSKLIDSIYKTEPENICVAFNNRIINNTMAYAISSKSLPWANAASNFTRVSWGKNYLEAQKASSLKMIQYYLAIKDTTNYLRQAIYFYDQNYMRLTKDSIEKKNSREFEIAKANAEEIAKKNQSKTTSFITTKTNFDDIGIQLNNAAFQFYLTGTKNPTYINKAVEWSKRSIEINPIYGFYDTLAHLLYRLDYFAEAEFNQQKAIDLAKSKSIDIKNLKEELFKMKNKTL